METRSVKNRERLQKRIAQSGLCSRRAAEQLILEGKVAVNGQIVSRLGSTVSETDQITVNKQTLPKNQNISIALHKPAGYVSSRFDPEGRKTIVDLLPKNLHHLKPVGRLDQDSEGLLLLSTDGDLILTLTHPRFEHSKTYHVTIEGSLSPEDLNRIHQGRFQVAGKTLQPMPARILKQSKGTTLLEIILREGRKRQIRRMFERLEHPVLSLQRMAIGKLKLGSLKKGSYRTLSKKDIELAKQ